MRFELISFFIRLIGRLDHHRQPLVLTELAQIGKISIFWKLGKKNKKKQILLKIKLHNIFYIALLDKILKIIK